MPQRARPSLADRAYTKIRDEILEGQLRPGTALSRRRLAGKLGMSFIPVTDALRRLESEGLVESRARAGTRVRVPSEQDVRELYELREALETQSARLFAARASAAARRTLVRLADRVDVMFDRMWARPDDAAFRFQVHDLHVKLHMFVAGRAGSDMLRLAIERNHVLVLNWLFDVTGRRTPLPPGFHARLAKELVSGDPTRADAAMRAHVRYGLAEVAGQLGHGPSTNWREPRATAS